jgi:hypothetical protein
MNEPMDRPPELDELVALLRSATPSEPVVTAARAGTLSAVKGSPLGGWVGPAARLLLAVTTIAAVGGLEVDRGDRAPAAVAPPAQPAPRSEPVADAPRPSTPLAPVIADAAEPLAPAPPAAWVSRRRAPSPRAKQDDVPAVQAPVASSAPSPALAQALRDYAAERYEAAAIGFQAVADGTSGDAPERVGQADFFLAKCLYHLELFHASAAAFDEVTQRGPEHPYFQESLRWLAMLAERLPETSGVIESVGRYDEASLAALDTPETRAHYHHLLYLLGRSRYEERRFREAIRLFRRVPADARVSLEARFFEGVSHVRLRHARPALAAFRRVVEGPSGGHPEASRLHDLAWISIARLYYSFAMQDEGDDASRELSLAIAAWRSVPIESEYWLDSFFEETWALYISRQYARALGHVHALESPYYRDRANPEALVVRSMIFFEHCQWDAVTRSLWEFHNRFDVIAEEAAQVERMAATNEDAFRMLMAVRARRSRVPVHVLPMIQAVFGDRELARYAAQVRSIDLEAQKLAAIGAPMLESAVHARVSSDLAIARSFAVERAGGLARERVHRLAEELNELMLQADTIELELATVRRDELQHPNPNPMGPVDGGPIYAVQGDQVWIFDDEWWRDELPFYMQDIRDRCSR